MCKVKKEGGIRFRELQAFNLAMLAKQGWRLHEEPFSLMAWVFKAKYFPNCDVLSANLWSNPSYAWRSIHKSLGVLSKVLDREWAMERKFTFGTINGCQPLQPIRSYLRQKTLGTSQWY